MLRGNIAASSLKMLLKNLYSVKCNDELNMNVLTLSLWENFWWGLIYFDQFIYINGQCPIIKTCSDVTLNLSSKDSISTHVKLEASD